MAHAPEEPDVPDRPPDGFPDLPQPPRRLANVKGFSGCLLLLFAAGILIVWPAAVFADWLEPQTFWPASLTLVLIGFLVWVLTRSRR